MKVVSFCEWVMNLYDLVAKLSIEFESQHQCFHDKVWCLDAYAVQLCISKVITIYRYLIFDDNLCAEELW